MRAERSAVLLFARAPQVEAKDLSLPRAEKLAVFRSLLAHTLQTVRAARSPHDLLVAHDGPLGVDTGADLAFPQVGGSFAERLLHAVSTAAEAGYERLVLVGADTPQLTEGDLEVALTDGGAVVGPSDDGGFYLLSLPTAVAHRVLAELPWQTSAVMRSLTEALKHAGLVVHALDSKRDIDTSSDARASATLLRALCLQYEGVAPLGLSAAPDDGPSEEAPAGWLSSRSSQGPPPFRR